MRSVTNLKPLVRNELCVTKVHMSQSWQTQRPITSSMRIAFVIDLSGGVSLIRTALPE